MTNGVRDPNVNTIGGGGLGYTNLNDMTGPTSLNMSLSFSSVASYGMFPTETIRVAVE